MKLLASDYDGTLKTNIKNLKININAIQKFRNEGNKFAIVTGRSYKSILNEIQTYEIEYDYLVCNNGLIIFNNKGDIICKSELNDKDFWYIYNDLGYNTNYKGIATYNFYGSTDNLKDMLEICVNFKSSKEAKYYKQHLEKRKKNLLCYKDRKQLFIGNKLTKADAIKYIQKLEDIESCDIYTIGDNKNDIEMLKEFNGYRMLFSYPNMWLENIPITKDVHTLIKKIQK